MTTPAATRGTATDAAKLNNKFIVYGWKTIGTTESNVFKFYSVTYNGNVGSTTTNTNGWDYVDNISEPTSGTGVKQAIKYWDYSASQYDFIAWSCTGGTSLKELKTLTDAEREGSLYKEKALYFEPATASDAAGIYIADQNTVEKTSYKNAVSFTFRNMAAKVRLGIYETVPGYSVKDVKFYTTSSNVATDGKAYLFSAAAEFGSSANVTVKFRTDNKAVVSSDITSKVAYADFGTFTAEGDAEYKEDGSVYLGRTSNTASYGSGFQYVYPTTCTSALQLKLDYTLVAKDGYGEEIQVKGATATVPVQYADWKENFSYTYLFKITDQSGTPGTEGTDPKGLYPVTFDALVTSEDGKSQETVTTIETYAITTFQNGSTVDANGTYVADKPVYVSVKYNETNQILSASNTTLYTAVSLGGKDITEENLAYYELNQILLTPATIEYANQIDADDAVSGSAINFDGTNNYVAKFTPADNKTYVVKYTGTSGDAYKVIKVGTGSSTTTYTLEAYANAGDATKMETPSVAEGGTIYVKVKEGTVAVTGAAQAFTAAGFTVTETETAGTYKLVSKAESTGTQTVSLNGTELSITVVPYAFAADNVDVTKGSTATITLNYNGSAADIDAKDNFVITGTGLSITGVADGVVTISAADTSASGKIQYKNGGVVVAEATVTVN